MGGRRKEGKRGLDRGDNERGSTRENIGRYLALSRRKMAPLVCHQRQKCADSLTAEAALAC
ncbi:hypothetical protein EYF80_007220 [Liparis tanakae]|uniref:Uncharacterized protein n=1 Tax=Liparis tanakae TaxID=230148 RepID=A0A4Z2IWQ1_9TELE|nr:hypothetical protein EYF80_007220 [Liparis tanakae]